MLQDEERTIELLEIVMRAAMWSAVAHSQLPLRTVALAAGWAETDLRVLLSTGDITLRDVARLMHACACGLQVRAVQNPFLGDAADEST